MVGITSYGGYIPRPRISRKSIFQHIGWLAPGVGAFAQGEKAFCNFDEDSVTMAVAATQDCLVGKDKHRLDALYLASTSLPFADRLCSGIVATALNLHQNIATADFTSSQRAGTSALIAGMQAVKSGDQKSVLIAAADKRETKPASNQEMWFGDGAASVLLGDKDVIAEFKGSYSVTYDFVDHYRAARERFDYNWEDRWIRDEGYAKIIPEAVNGLLSKLGITVDQVDKLVYPCYFKSQHIAISKLLGVGREKVVDNMHEVCGETGTAHPLVMLVATLEQAKPGERIVIAGFGQGSDALCFEVTENIQKLAPRTGIQGSLARKKTIDNYIKYLKFRGLLETDMGIRAEQHFQTAQTALWRKRKMITGLVGGKCQECGTPQYPKMAVCIHPECGSVGRQVDYEFADVPATVKSFTGDMLAPTVDPPFISGMVQFDGGGRLMADFTDCELAELKVGLPVKMSFRQHHVDPGRGFTGYFWKAVPQVGAERDA